MDRDSEGACHTSRCRYFHADGRQFNGDAILVWWNLQPDTSKISRRVRQDVQRNATGISRCSLWHLIHGVFTWHSTCDDSYASVAFS